MSDEQDFDPIDPVFLQRISEVSDEDAEARARALRAGLEEYDLESEDLEVLEADWDYSDEPILLPALPVLAIVGRPNVGKSALVNRIALVAWPRRALPGFCSARQGSGRPSGRRTQDAARGVTGCEARNRRTTPHRTDRPPKRRQVFAA